MIDVTSRLCQGKRGVDRGGRGVCERACRGRAARMATPAAMCATHSLTTSPCARVTPRARARVESVATNARRARVRGERRRRRRRGAERRGRDALDVRCGLGPGAGLRGRALALEAFSPRERGASQAQARRHQRGVGKRRVRRRIRRRRRDAGDAGGSVVARRRSFSLDEDANLGSRLDALC